VSHNPDRHEIALDGKTYHTRLRACDATHFEFAACSGPPHPGAPKVCTFRVDRRTGGIDQITPEGLNRRPRAEAVAREAHLWLAADHTAYAMEHAPLDLGLAKRATTFMEEKTVWYVAALADFAAYSLRHRPQPTVQSGDTTFARLSDEEFQAHARTQAAYLLTLATALLDLPRNLAHGRQFLATWQMADQALGARAPVHRPALALERYLERCDAPPSTHHGALVLDGAAHAARVLPVFRGESR